MEDLLAKPQNLEHAKEMATCFLCGRTIDPKSRHFRRKVKTGEWSRTRYPKPVTSVNTHFGMRIVCKQCAYRIDRERKKEEWLQLAELALALLVLAILLAMRFL